LIVSKFEDDGKTVINAKSIVEDSKLRVQLLEVKTNCEAFIEILDGFEGSKYNMRSDKVVCL
jgi:hypothetical protein